MAQIRTFQFTNPATAVVVNLDVGFTVSEIKTIDPTGGTGGTFEWVVGMADASYIDGTTGLTVTTNGFTPLSQSSAYGATMSGFTNANPGVITCSDTAIFGFAAGDTVRVEGLSDDGADAALGLNGNYTVASLTATTITLDQNTTSDNVYVSDGVVTRVSDTAGLPIPTENFAIRGMTIGLDAVGEDAAVITVIVMGENPVT